MMLIFSNNMVGIIKTITFIQSIFLVGLVILAYVLKYYLYVKKNKTEQFSQQIKHLLISEMYQGQAFQCPAVFCLQKNQRVLISIIEMFDQEQKSEQWRALRKSLITHAVLPNARRLAQSIKWENRYLACRGFKLSIHPQDMDTMKALIEDPISVISIHAALIAVHYSSEMLVNAVITSFAKGRHIQQSLYAQLVSSTSPYLVDFVNARIVLEHDPYVKVFCYRMLSNLAFTITPKPLAYADVYSDNLELRLAVMVYLSIHDKAKVSELFISFLQETQWEVRAIATRLLGKIGPVDVCHAIEPCLHDPIWWVRVNAAEALAALGVEGLAILKKQTATADQYAYDVAMEVLTTMKEEIE